MDFERRLATLGHALPAAPAPAANYVPFTIAKGLVFVAAIFELAD